MARLDYLQQNGIFDAQLCMPRSFYVTVSQMISRWMLIESSG
jgi:hypothetical protein